MTRHRTLVTFATKRGSTAELAAKIADTLRARDFEVDCRPVSDVDDLSSYDAVIIGGALYMNRWPREGRRFVKRHSRALRERRVWMFSSGPLHASAKDHDIGPTKQTSRLMALAGARGHATFGGRLARDADGHLASAMAKTRAGDWRDWEQVHAWATGIADTLASEPRPTAVEVGQPTSRLIAVLCSVVGLTAIGGAIALIAAPDGSYVHMHVTELRHSPFTSFLIPGLLLGVVIGFGNLLAAILELRGAKVAKAVAFSAGAALLTWTVTEMAMLRAFQFLQPVYLLVAVVILIESLRHGASARALLHTTASPRRADHRGFRRL